MGMTLGFIIRLGKTGGAATPSRVLQVPGLFAVVVSGQKIQAGVPAVTLMD